MTRARRIRARTCARTIAARPARCAISPPPWSPLDSVAPRLLWRWSVSSRPPRRARRSPAGELGRHRQGPRRVGGPPRRHHRSTRHDREPQVPRPLARRRLRLLDSTTRRCSSATSRASSATTAAAASSTRTPAPPASGTTARTTSASTSSSTRGRPPSTARCGSMGSKACQPRTPRRCCAAATGALPRGARFDEDAYKQAQDGRRARAHRSRVRLRDGQGGSAGRPRRARDRLRLHRHAGHRGRLRLDHVPGPRPGRRAPGNPRSWTTSRSCARSTSARGTGTRAPRSTPRPRRCSISRSSAPCPSSRRSRIHRPAVVPLVVKVEPGKLRLLRLGGGAEFDAIKTDVHGLVGWEDRNFLGGLRDFNVELKPGLVFYPTRLGNLQRADGSYLPDASCPRSGSACSSGSRASSRRAPFGFVQPEFNVFPLLVEHEPCIRTRPSSGTSSRRCRSDSTGASAST